jgi:hypothetical protein
MQQQFQQQQQQFAQAPQYNQQPNPAPMMFVPPPAEKPTTTTTPTVVAPTTAPNTNATATTAENAVAALSGNKHLFKRLPEENFQNQEVKGRFVSAVMILVNICQLWILIQANLELQWLCNMIISL